MDALNRTLAPLLATALLVLGVLVPVEVIRARAGGEGHLVLPYGSVADQLREWSWNDTWPLVISALLLALGLLLVLAQLGRRRGGLVLLKTDVAGVDAGLRSSSLASAVADAATEVDGVSEAKARVRRRRVTVKAVSHLHDVSGLQEKVHAHVRSWVDDLDLVRPLDVRAELKQEER